MGLVVARCGALALFFVLFVFFFLYSVAFLVRKEDARCLLLFVETCMLSVIDRLLFLLYPLLSYVLWLWLFLDILFIIALKHTCERVLILSTSNSSASDCVNEVFLLQLRYSSLFCFNEISFYIVILCHAVIARLVRWFYSRWFVISSIQSWCSAMGGLCSVIVAFLRHLNIYWF